MTFSYKDKKKMFSFFFNDLKAFILNLTLNMLSFNYLPIDSHLFTEPLF